MECPVLALGHSAGPLIHGRANLVLDQHADACAADAGGRSGGGRRGEVDSDRGR